MSVSTSLIRPITRADIKGPALYAGIRDDLRKRIIELKRARRVIVGDRVSMVFENRHTLTVQIEEMCRTEGMVRDDQIQSEIDVYNALMPTRDSLSATLFIELPPEADPYAELKKLVGLDEHVILHVGDHALRAHFEPGRSTDDKISAVQYLRFPLTAGARRALADTGTAVSIEIDHPQYQHRVPGPSGFRESLARDYASVDDATVASDDA